MQWIKKLFGIRCPERITKELIERLPADKLCRNISTESWQAIWRAKYSTA